MKLTEEKLERAARIYQDAISENVAGIMPWEGVDLQGRAEIQSALRAAAPFLQLPIAEPTDEELQDLRNGTAKGIDGDTASWKVLVLEFVQARNVASQKTADPRRTLLIEAFKKRVNPSNFTVEELATVALEALR